MFLIPKKIYLLSCIWILSGCTAARIPLATFNNSLQQDHWVNAQHIAQTNAEHIPTHENLVWLLQSASLDRLLLNYEKSNTTFDQAEKSFAYFDQRLAVNRAGRNVGGILWNDSALPYIGTNYDRIMVNTYKALNFAALGDTASARVEFNRALHRQSIARDRFRKEISFLQDHLKETQGRHHEARDTIERSVKSPHINQLISNKYRNLESFTAYADFVNPFTTYISGLYFWLIDDTDKAVDLLKEAYAMTGKHRIVANDFKRADKGQKPFGEAWIIFENGLAPRREETRLDLPILIEDSPIYYVGTAVPNLSRGLGAYPYLKIQSKGQRPVKTEIVADMETIINEEFKKELPGIITREVARVALKTYLQYELHENYGEFGGILSSLYQAATTRADLRMWTALPNDFQVAHLKIPSDRILNISPPNGVDFPIIIPKDSRNVIIYIRFVNRISRPVVSLISF